MALNFLDKSKLFANRNDEREPSVNNTIFESPTRRAEIIVSKNGSGDFDNIQEAIDSLPSEGGLVFIDEGTYIITERIVIDKSSVSIIGNSWGVIIKGEHTDGGGDNQLFYASNVNNLIFQNFQCQDISFTSHCIFLSNCDHCEIKNIKMLDLDNGISLASCEYCNVNNCFGDTFAGDDSIFLSGTSKYNVIKNNFILDGVQIRLEGANYNVIEGNIIINSGLDGITIEGSNNNIVNNIVSNADQYGISVLTNSDNNLINGNRITGAFVGIIIDVAVADKNLVTSNNLVGNTTAFTDNGTTTTAANNNS